MNRRAIYVAMAIAALGSVGGGLVRRDGTDKPEPTPEELAKQLEERRASAAERREREAYYRRMEDAERARHPATRTKPQSESLKRLLGKNRRRHDAG